MQAIVETLFDAVYLISVITIGILMIRGSKGRSQYRLFGVMAVVLGAGDSFHLVPRALALCTTGLENYTVPLGLGKWITSITMTIFYVILYYVWRQRYQIKGRNGITAAVYILAGSVHDASERLAQRLCAPVLGYLAEYPLRPAGSADHCSLLPQRRGAE